MNINSGLDKARLVSNILMVLLLVGNIYFSINFLGNKDLLDKQNTAIEQKTAQRLATAKFMKYFIDTVLNTKDKNGEIAFEDRVKLENDIIQLHDPEAKKLWDSFVASKDNKTSQESVVKLMSLLSSRMI